MTIEEEAGHLLAGHEKVRDIEELLAWSKSAVEFIRKVRQIKSWERTTSPSTLKVNR